MEYPENLSFEFAKALLDKLPAEERASLYLRALAETTSISASYALQSVRILEHAASLPPHIQAAMRETLEKFVVDMAEHVNAIYS